MPELKELNKSIKNVSMKSDSIVGKNNAQGASNVLNNNDKDVYIAEPKFINSNE